MMRLTLTDDAQAAVPALRQARTLASAERDRVELVLLSAAGRRPPPSAAPRSGHAKTVRVVRQRVRERGVASLHRRRPGPPPHAARRARLTAARAAVLGRDRPGTAAQWAAARAAPAIRRRLRTRQTRQSLTARGARWRRTAPTLRHTQDPATGGPRPPAPRRADTKAAQGRVARASRDACGVAPRQAVTGTGARPRPREGKRGPSAHRPGRRLKTRAVRGKHGAPPARYGAHGRPQHRRSGHALPPRPAAGRQAAGGVGVVVRDPAALPRSPGVRDARPGRWTKRRCLS